jgi:hypothetical protein
MSDVLTFEVANPQQQSLALALRSQVYAEDLGRVVNDHLDQHSYHLVACAERDVVAAVRVIGPEQRPFDCETILSEKGAVLSLGPRPALIGRLCVRRDFRAAHRSTALHLGLLRLTVEFGLQQAFSEYLLYTFPGLTRFYQGASFELTGIDFPHPDWGRLHVMRLDLSNPASNGIAQILSGRPSAPIEKPRS